MVGCLVRHAYCFLYLPLLDSSAVGAPGIANPGTIRKLWNGWWWGGSRRWGLFLLGFVWLLKQSTYTIGPWHTGLIRLRMLRDLCTNYTTFICIQELYTRSIRPFCYRKKCDRVISKKELMAKENVKLAILKCIRIVSSSFDAFENYHYRRIVSLLKYVRSNKATNA